MEYKKVDLPSRLKAYKDIDEIKIRSLTGKDEKVIAYSNPENLETKFIELLKDVIVGVDPKDLTLGDRAYLLLWLTIDSFGKNYGPVDFYCEHCFNKISDTIDLDSFNVKKLPEDFVQPYEIKLSDSSLKLRLLTINDELKVLEREKQDKNSWLYRYALTVEDGEKTIEEKEKILESLSLKDLGLVKAFHKKFEHGPEMSADYKCSICGGEGRVAVPFQLEMLFPDDKTLEVRFGSSI